MMQSKDVVSAEDDEEESKPEAVAPQRASAAMFERNRDIIRRRALLAQRQAQANGTAPVETAAPSATEEDPREVLRRRREALKQRTLAERSQARPAMDSTPSTGEKVDPRELLRRRREAIRAKALAARAKENDED